MNETKNLKGDVSPLAPIDLLDAAIPERIFLQIGECEKWEDLPIDWKEVSWCADKIFNNDIEYIRVHKSKRKQKQESV